VLCRAMASSVANACLRFVRRVLLPLARSPPAAVLFAAAVDQPSCNGQRHSKCPLYSKSLRPGLGQCPDARGLRWVLKRILRE